MNRYRDILLIILLLIQPVWLGLALRKPVEPDRTTGLNIGRPVGVFTVNYGENPKKFKINQFYVLKALRITDKQVDYGFCPIEGNDDAE